ncbi:ribosomal maturation YjgA family protein [Sphingomonas sp. Leaf22]|uniref:ribosomal maturation YjgA family protein n=1 Tax=Sphingomonas sp. Leaf22 TaxID=1735687 RepID=UPI0009EA8C3D|nr:DUF2809 domain-containing protein [Sphingomonas sp. Leaf22]
MRLHKGYAALTIALLAIELAIALFLHDPIIRPYVGDALAVVLVYAGLRAVTSAGVLPATLIAFAIAVVIEFGQYFRVLAAIGLDHDRFTRMILGSGFDPKDFIAYASGAVAVLLVERYRRASRAAAGIRTVSPSSDSSSTI